MSDDGGRFVWYDLMTTDPDAAQSFYTKLIGWGTQAWDGPMPYTMWTNNDTPLGGVMALSDEAKQAGAPPHWLAYIYTSDVDGTVATAEENQAKVLVPAQDIPKVGRFAVIADPQGAAFAVYTPETDTPGNPGPSANRSLVDCGRRFGGSLLTFTSGPAAVRSRGRQPTE